MTSPAISADELQGLVTRLRESGVRADTDPAQLDTPAVWVQWTGGTDNYLGGYTLRTRLSCVVDDEDYQRAQDALVRLANQVRDQFGRPDGDWFFYTLVQPDGTTRPALAMPYDLLAEHPENED